MYHILALISIIIIQYQTSIYSGNSQDNMQTQIFMFVFTFVNINHLFIIFSMCDCPIYCFNLKFNTCNNIQTAVNVYSSEKIDFFVFNM